MTPSAQVSFSSAAAAGSKVRSAWAVVAGFLFVAIASTAVDILLHVTGVYPAWGEPMGHGLAALALSYRLVIGVGGGWVVARLAPRHPMKHALVLGVIGTLFALAGALATWNTALAPNWYALLLVVAALPQCWLGGKLATRQGSA